MTHAFPTRRSSDLDQVPEVGAVEELLIRVPPTDQALATEAVLFRVHPTVTDRDGHGPGSNRDLAGDELRDLLVPTGPVVAAVDAYRRSEEHTSELQSLMRISYAVFCLKKKH